MQREVLAIFYAGSISGRHGKGKPTKGMEASEGSKEREHYLSTSEGIKGKLVVQIQR